MVFVACPNAEKDMGEEAITAPKTPALRKLRRSTVIYCCCMIGSGLGSIVFAVEIPWMVACASYSTAFFMSVDTGCVKEVVGFQIVF